nr:MAG: replication polyprotein [Owegonang virus 13]
MGDRGTCWSITINNPTAEELKPSLPAQWVLQGQMEKGKEGTEHFQGMLTTPQVRFSAVKKVLPRAHIELARNKQALAQYIRKEETRNGEYTVVNSAIPSLFEYQTKVAARVNEAVIQGFYDDRLELWVHGKIKKQPDIDEIAMDHLDRIVEQDIADGVRGVEYIAINPMWRSSWKKFWRSIIKRDASLQAQPSPQADEAPPPPQGDAERVCEGH